MARAAAPILPPFPVLAAPVLLLVFALEARFARDLVRTAPTLALTVGGIVLATVFVGTGVHLAQRAGA